MMDRSSRSSTFDITLSMSGSGSNDRMALESFLIWYALSNIPFLPYLGGKLYKVSLPDSPVFKKILFSHLRFEPI